MNTHDINILLIGCGPHAKRIYIPLLERTESVNYVHVVDIESKRKDISNFLGNRIKEYTTFFIKKKDMKYDRLSKPLEKHLNIIIKEKSINGVIIASEPLTHMAYAKWCLKNDLTVLMDKPISTYKDISTNTKLAKRVKKDYDDLLKGYNKAIKRNPLISFSLQSQRRFHPAYLKIKELIEGVYKKTNCPVTSIQSYHCDGQWRMPTEIVEQLYHPYFQGYGKCSHSGYHFFDIVPYILESGFDKDKKYDNMDISTSFVRPLDFLEQFTLKDYKNVFGIDFDNYNKYTIEDYEKKMKKYGEIDAYNKVIFKKGHKIITVATINLLHNGFSRRDWVSADGRDLYKGNGRIRHESHIIQQGPFQTIQFHSYQSKEVDINAKDDLYKLGGELHLEIFVFRNSKIIGGKLVEKINIKNLYNQILDKQSRGHQEDARAIGYFEFIESLQGIRKREDMTSDLSKHKVGAYITSGIYESAGNQYKNSNKSIINIKLPSKD